MKQALIGLLLLFCIALGFLWEWVELPDALPRFEKLPLVGEHYIGENLPLLDWEKTFFHKVNVLKRYYRVGDQQAFITALDGTHNRHVVHDPYYCFKGSGWELKGRRPITINGGQARILNLEKQGETREVLYWFSDGHIRHASIVRYLWQATLRKFTFGHSGPEPLLIMVQPVGKPSLDWDKLPQDFPELFKL